MADPVPNLDYWRLSPDSYARVASRGRWIQWPHLEYAARVVRDTILAGNGRLIFSSPPRHGKSEFFSHWLPVWFFDLWPEKRIILTSYGDRLSRFFGRRIKAELEGNPSVGVKTTRESHSAMEFDTDSGGGLVASGIGGAITGRGADLICIDDPIKTMEEAMSETIRESHREWFDSTLYTRLEPKGTIVVIATRWHEKDLSGYLAYEHADKWTVINFPAVAEENDSLGRSPGQALCPERYDESALAAIRQSVGSRVWAALYQGRPAPQEGAIWKKQYWKRWASLPEKFDEIVQSWDANLVEGGSSFIVGQVWGKAGADRYLLDQIRGKWGFTETISKFRQLCAKWPLAARKLVENKANGPAIQDMLKHEISGIVLVEPQGGKEVRAIAAEPELEAGNIWIPEDEVAYPWVREFIEECAVFPNGANDDQVDAAGQALAHFRSSPALAYGGKDRKRPTRRRLA